MVRLVRGVGACFEWLEKANGTHGAFGKLLPGSRDCSAGKVHVHFHRRLSEAAAEASFTGDLGPGIMSGMFSSQHRL